MEQNVSDVSGGGVILKPPAFPVKRPNSAKNWCFTYYPDPNNFDMELWLQHFNNSGIKYYFGDELCPDTGRRHLQGFLKSDTKIRPIECKKLAFMKDKSPHFEAMKGSIEENIKYCKKDGKVYYNIELPEELEDPFEINKPYDWQQKILDMIKEKPHKRKIYWYWSEEGGIGKTDLVFHILMHNRERATVVSGKAADIKYAIASKMQKTKKFPKIIIFHFPRTIDPEYISYTAIEEVKDRMFFSTKYESGECLFNTPHVLVFCNFEPDVNKMSNDRWVITKLD